MTRVLIVDDDPPLLLALTRMLAAMDCEVVAASDGLKGQAQLADHEFDLVITDLRMPHADGFSVLEATRSRQPGTPVIVVTGQGSIADCVRAMRAGAVDFIGKPFHAEQLRQVVRSALRGEVAHDAGPRAAAPGGSLIRAALLGDSPQLRAVLEQVERVASTDLPVVLVGEPHTGKDAVARLLHAVSQRAGSPLIVVACGDLTADGLGGELFGDGRGGGKLAQAEGGTLLLTGIQPLEPELHGQLVRALEPCAARSRCDVRLLVDIDAQQARSDDASSLAHTLANSFGGVVIHMPALRERAEDLPVLVDYLVESTSRRLGRQVHSDALRSAMERYPWPGNLDELETRISRYVSAAPPEQRHDADDGPNVFLVPVDRFEAALVLGDGTRKQVVLARGHGQPIDALLTQREPFVAVQEGGRTRIYARTALACLVVRDAGEPATDALPHDTRAVRVTLRSGAILDGELRYVPVEGRARLTDVLNDDAPTFCIHADGEVHHVVKAHVLCVEET